MDVQVILTETDPKLGERGEVIKVAQGFAANFLFPQKKAIRVTSANLKIFEAEKAKRTQKAFDSKAEAEALAKKIESSSLTVEVLVGEANKLYGAVTAQDIHQACLRQDLKLEKRQIHLAEPIHQLGDTAISVKLHPEVTAKLKLSIIKKR